MNNIFHYILVTIFLISSCKDNTIQKNFVDGKQLPIIGASISKIDIIGLDSIMKDKEFCAYIVQKGEMVRMVDAYIGSHQDNYCYFGKSLVDTTLKQIDNCSFRLKTVNDTAFFCMTPTASKNYFYKVAVLSIDKELNYYLDTLDMSFDAKEKTNP